MHTLQYEKFAKYLQRTHKFKKRMLLVQITKLSNAEINNLKENAIKQNCKGTTKVPCWGDKICVT